MTLTKEIQLAVGKMQVLKFHSPVVENISAGFQEMDVMSINKSGFLYEFEVKISRSDFKADAHKPKHKHYCTNTRDSTRCPNYFSYVCPAGLLSIDDIPEYAGLYHYSAGVIIEVRNPPILHKDKKDLTRIFKTVCRLTSERLFLGCARKTYEDREHKKRRQEIDAIYNSINQ